MQNENLVFNIKGDKKSKAEPIQHTIAFPGGHIGVVRTTNNEYWAHIWVNQQNHEDNIQFEKFGFINKIRLDLSEGYSDIDIPKNTNHFAVFISTVEPKKEYQSFSEFNND
jgi:hypothetical protein